MNINTLYKIRLSVIMLFLIAAIAQSQIFISPGGDDVNGDGTINDPYATLTKAMTIAAAGSTVYLRGGGYNHSSTITISTSGASGQFINLWAYNNEVPVLDFSTMTGSSDGVKLTGSYIYFKGVRFTGAGHNGLNVSGHYNIIENCAFYDNRNSGFQMGSSSSSANPSNNVILNCDAYRNYDAPIGGNADGYAVKWNIGTGNAFRGCRAYNNSDDGWDLWMAINSIVMDSCMAFRNGVDIWHSGSFNGNGNGFKLGGNNVATPHTTRNCVAFDNAGNTGRGFDENNNLSGQTVYNCTAFRNTGDNYHFNNTVTQGSHSIKNCISYQGNVSITSGTQLNNSWQGFTVSNSDFQNFDTTLAVLPRNSDGSLQETAFLKLTPGSSLIDAGVNVGIAYSGAAPDLGAYESLSTDSGGDFRTFQSGDWNDVNSWERFDGSLWIHPAPNIPTSADGAITIRFGHTITVNMDTTVDQMTIAANGLLVVAATKRLTVADGADSIDMIIEGTLNQFGMVSATGRISVENGGLLIYSAPGGVDIAMPNYSWRIGSTIRIDSTTGTAPTNLKNQSLCNLVWNGTRMGANGGPNFNDGTIITGDVTLQSSNKFQWRIANFSGGQTKNIYIRGNINVVDTSALLTSTGSGADTLAKAIINVDGNVNVTAGTWSLINSSNMYAEWKIKGNVNITGGSLTSGASGWAYRRTLNFCGGTSQSFTLTAPATMGTAATVFKVSNGATVQMNFPLTLSAGSVLNLENGKFVTSSANLMTIPATGAILGGNSSSYVDGPLAIVIASSSPTSKTFPIGKGASYRPVILSVNHESATATTYTAEMFNTAPPSRNLESPLLGVSSVRYYTIAKGSGAILSPTLGATVQITYTGDDLVNSAATVRIAKDDGAGNWKNLGGSGTTDTTGSITSNAFYSFSDFVLATADTSVPSVPPTVTTTAITYISTTFATSGGNVTNDGGGPVLERGICWNTTGSPTIADSKTTNGTGAGVFTGSLTGLIPGTLYYVRAYGTNAAGTGYGNELTFSTLSSIIPPSVTTTAISNIQVTTAVSGGTVTEWGGDSVTARGICWNTTGAPTISGSHSVDGSGLGSYASGLSKLTGGTAYYVRAYAINSSGTGYGNELTFTTQTPQPDTTVIVAQDGSGNYTTVQEAFRAVPVNYTGKWTIFVKKGVYYEKDTLASGKNNVVLVGEDRDSTIITFDDYADSHGSGVPGTSGSFTIAIDASDFTAKNITFRNTYSPQPGVTGTQAVALRTQGDRHEYINCKILGYQDTYYTWGGNGTGRMYHRNCYIEGTVDFIFGRNIVVFDSCTIHEIRNSGTLTAGSTDASSKYGYVFRNCAILADSIGYDGNPITSFYLGRPWQASPRTVFINSYEPSRLHASGWLAWNVTPALYGEFNCFGEGSPTGGRVAWSSQLTDSATKIYSLSNIFARSSSSSSLILYDWMPANPMSDEPLLYRLTASAGTNGSISDAGISNVMYNGTKQYHSTPAEGYFVDSLLIDGVSITPDTSYTFLNVTSNHTVRAVFAVASMTTITASAGEHGVISPQGNVAVLQGADQQFTITPADGYHIDSLIIDGIQRKPAASYTFHYVTTPHTIRATFALTKIFTLTTYAFHGSVTRNPNAASYDSATVVQLTAVPDYGYHFTGWTEDITSTDNPFSITMNSNKIVVANFALDTVTIPISYNDRWNLISVPVLLFSERMETNLPSACSPYAFSYDGGYRRTDSLQNGKGYWVKICSGAVTQWKGLKLVSLEIPVHQGWNLIGSISDPINTSEIGGVVAGATYYSFNNGYRWYTHILPGKGYWVRASADGTILLESNPFLQYKDKSDIARNMEEEQSLLNHFAQITIKDANGGDQLLYIGRDANGLLPLEKYELPPAMGDDIFDARFASGRMVEVFGKNRSSQYPIRINPTAYPLTISWDVPAGNGNLMLSYNGNPGQMICGKGTIKINDAEIKELVLTATTEGIPTGFSLMQNYPNPFNPETNIQFSVETTEKTTLEVFNILGQKVATLFNDIAEPGQYYYMKFNSGNIAGGVYYYRLQSGNKNEMKPMLLVK